MIRISLILFSAFHFEPESEPSLLSIAIRKFVPRLFAYSSSSFNPILYNFTCGIYFIIGNRGIKPGRHKASNNGCGQLVDFTRQKNLYKTWEFIMFNFREIPARIPPCFLF
jgi:hypothetical protein